jgi:hypothetical protein
MRLFPIGDLLLNYYDNWLLNSLFEELITEAYKSDRDLLNGPFLSDSLSSYIYKGKC